MNNLYIKAILAGVCFGIWPLMMNRSGLNGNLSVFILNALTLICVFAFAVGSMKSSAAMNWDMIISAGVIVIFGLVFISDSISGIAANWKIIIASAVIGSCGMLLFNGMLAQAAENNVGFLIVTMTIMQTLIPAIYQVVMNGITAIKTAGFILAVVAMALLLI